jgi:hypothetical protein
MESLDRDPMASHLVTKLHHAALVGFDLRQMESDVSVELLEERIPSPIKIGRIE